MNYKHEQQREQLARDLDAFQRRGGRIEVIPSGIGSGRNGEDRTEDDEELESA